jgi:membrane associated rhomboid family serine protease
VIPLKDDNPTNSPAVVTLLIIAACVVVYFLIQPAGQGTVQRQSVDVATKETLFDLRHAAIACEIVHDRPLTVDEIRATYIQHDTTACGVGAPSSPPGVPGKAVLLAVLYSMFLHGSVLHIGGNMLFLWIFGNNVEDRFGKVPYLVFYLIAGLVATATQVLSQPSSTVPLVGASGAIAGVMGAYLVLFPNAPIFTYIFPIFFFRIRAFILLIFWFLSQFFVNPASGVAWVAHVGGFTFGILVGLIWKSRSTPGAVPVRY